MAFARQAISSLLMVTLMVLRPAFAVDPNASSTETSTDTSTTGAATATVTSSSTGTSASNTSAHTTTRTCTTGTPTSTTIATSTNTATSSITRTRGFDCLGNPSTFDAGWGACNTYSLGSENYFYCDEDFDQNNLFAMQVCPQCGVCVYNGSTTDTINPTVYNQTFECLGNASTFDAGYGNCSSYAEELDYNWDYCGGDYDNETGLFAFQVCSECQRCYPSPPETETNTLTTPAHTATATTVFTATTTISVLSSTAASTATSQPTELEYDVVSAARQGSGMAMGHLLLLLCAACSS